MIGYYIHHHGSGHLHRATSIAHALGQPVTGLSSLPKPGDWPGDWVDLPLDTDGAPALDPTAGGVLHWVPVGSAGLRGRMAAISAWIASAAPAGFVVDVSVEVALLARLHGVPVITMGQPGDRTDAAHTLGYAVSAAVLAPWPAVARPLTRRSGPAETSVGAISRIAVIPAGERVSRRVVVLRGRGSRGPSPLGSAVEAIRTLGGWEMVEAKGGAAAIAAALADATVVLSHCGQNAVAEIAATRSPAILIPEDRPHDEQRSLARALRELECPALVLDAEMPRTSGEWGALLEQAARLDGASWQVWCPGDGASLAAAAILSVSTTMRSTTTVGPTT